MAINNFVIMCLHVEDCARSFERARIETTPTKHQLWHVMIEFVAPVDGPLVLGDGRFVGLGVMAVL